MKALNEVQPADKYFTKEALESAKSQNALSSSRLFYLPHWLFLRLARNGHGDHKEKRVRQMLRRGEKFPDIPYLWLDNIIQHTREYERNKSETKCIVVAHEGRHRTRAIAAMGIEMIPVVINTTASMNINWFNGDTKRPKYVLSQDGNTKWYFNYVFREKWNEDTYPPFKDD